MKNVKKLNKQLQILSEKENKNREEKKTKLLKKSRKKIFYYPICVLCPFALDFSPTKKVVDCELDGKHNSVGRCDTFDEIIKFHGINHPKFKEWKKHQLRLDGEMKGRLLKVSEKWKHDLLMDV